MLKQLLSFSAGLAMTLSLSAQAEMAHDHHAEHGQASHHSEQKHSSQHEGHHGDHHGNHDDHHKIPALTAEQKALGQAGVTGMHLMAVDGTHVILGGEQGDQPAVLVFMGHQCPISRRFVPVLNELAAHAKQQGLAFYGVFSDEDATVENTKVFQDEYEIQFSLLMDPGFDVARTLQPIAKPEAFVVNQGGVLAYRGRIDDRFASLGRLRNVINHYDLKNAIDAVSAGNLPEVTRTQPVGCFFDPALYQG